MYLLPFSAMRDFLRTPNTGLIFSLPLDKSIRQEYIQNQAEIPDSGMRGNQEVGAYSVNG